MATIESCKKLYRPTRIAWSKNKENAYKNHDNRLRRLVEIVR